MMLLNYRKAGYIQAATLLYHTVKTKLMDAKIFGMRMAFLCLLALPYGRTEDEMETPDTFLSQPGAPQFSAGMDIDEEYREI